MLAAKRFRWPAFLATQYLAFGQFTPVYEEFGTRSYQYEGSYWNTPLEMDWYNASTMLPGRDCADDGAVRGLLRFYMTIGHHGVFSLSPIFLFSLVGAFAVAGGALAIGRCKRRPG